MFSEKQQYIMTIAVHIGVPPLPVGPSDNVEGLGVIKDPATGQQPDGETTPDERALLEHMTAVERRRSRWAGRRRSWH